MPLIKYRDYRAKPVSREVIRLTNEILEEYAEQGLDLTLRQLHYQFVRRDIYPEEWVDVAYNERLGLDPETKNTQKNYDRLSDVIAAAREAGMVDWDAIKDRGRKVSRFSHWRDATHFIQRVVRQFAIDMWADQPQRVEVWVEKDALSQVIEQAADPFDVPTFAAKGYASASSLWEAAHNRFLQWAQTGQDIVVLHLADHDPSGVHMTEDLQKRLNMYSRHYGELKPCHVTVRRIALTLAQVEQYNPPPNPAKESDSRKPAYVRQFGVEQSWELDALDPPVLIALIREAIQEEMDAEKYEARRASEQQQTRHLKLVAAHWEEVTEFLDDEFSSDDDGAVPDIFDDLDEDDEDDDDEDDEED